MKENPNNKKVYVNAIFKSLRLQYFMVITVFMIGPLGLLFLFFEALKVSDSLLNPVIIIFAAFICFVFIVLILFFFFLRKCWVFKIVTNNAGITSNGFLKNFYFQWKEVICIKTSSDFLGKRRAEVRTHKGKFYFPLTMNEKNTKYPKLVMGLTKWRWIDANGIEKPISLENCPLYIEIQKHLDE